MCSNHSSGLSFRNSLSRFKNWNTAWFEQCICKFWVSLFTYSHILIILHIHWFYLHTCLLPTRFYVSLYHRLAVGEISKHEVDKFDFTYNHTNIKDFQLQIWEWNLNFNPWMYNVTEEKYRRFKFSYVRTRSTILLITFIIGIWKRKSVFRFFL